MSTYRDSLVACIGVVMIAAALGYHLTSDDAQRLHQAARFVLMALLFPVPYILFHTWWADRHEDRPKWHGIALGCLLMAGSYAVLANLTPKPRATKAPQSEARK